MTAAFFIASAIRPAFSLLPVKMSRADDEATAMLVAIAIQESALTERRQKPVAHAKGFTGFERVGVEDVLVNPATRVYAAAVCRALDIHAGVESVHQAIEFNDVLCAAFSRLNLWKFPGPLPGRDEIDRSWFQYVSIWRPGAVKTNPEGTRARWATAYPAAWDAVRATRDMDLDG